MELLTLEKLPPLILRYIAHYLSNDDIKNLCCYVPPLDKAIWNNNDFWCQKFKDDFGGIVQNYNGRWKDLYFASAYSVTSAGDLRHLRLSPELTLVHVCHRWNSVAALDINGSVWICGCSRFESDNNSNLEMMARVSNTKAKQISFSERHMIIIDLNDTYLVSLMGCSCVEHPDQKAKIISRDIVLDINNDVWYCILFHVDFWDICRYVKMEDIKGKFISGGINCGAVIDLDDNLWILNPREILYQGTSIQPNMRVQGHKFKFVSVGFNNIAAIDLANNAWFISIVSDEFKLTKISDINVEEVAVGPESTLLRDKEGNIFMFDNSDKIMKIEGIKGRKISFGGTNGLIIGTK